MTKAPPAAAKAAVPTERAVAPAGPAVSVHAEGLVKCLGRAEALSGVSFWLSKGEVFGLTGPNGAGKTTLLRVLAGLCRPDAGWAEVAGTNAAAEPLRLRRLVGYVPEHFGMYERLTAAEYLAFYAACYRLPRHQAARAVTDLLALVGLAADGDQPVASFSRGMNQRLCIARALVHDPEVLLLDEPASGLDPRARGEFVELVAALGEMGKTVVLASQILSELAEVCTSFGILHDGRMVAWGTAPDLLAGGGDLRELYLSVTERPVDRPERGGATAAGHGSPDDEETG